ncbi:MAG TPA: ABC transporter ATP-binding protein [Alphaproteobacteria bacterium]|jgi:NitT/TauT family transport system ATP-binding protein
MQLAVQNITHRYGDLHVLDDVSLTVRAGETFALIGPSGCGKSTLLGIMGGMLRPAAGAVAASGAPPVGCLNPFTYVFQDFALLPWRTVAGNVALALEHHPLGGAEREARIGEVLALCGLADFAHAYPKQLSGGMRQRVGIARAIAVKPAVLLMDEPLSALDAQTRDLLIEDLIAIWARERTTSIYVTHNLSEALRLADRVGVLSRRPGRLIRVIEIAIPREARARPERAGEMARLHDALWTSIRHEAEVAEREMQHV